jgi:AraC family ethanolamine operon transcriptional activator
MINEVTKHQFNFNDFDHFAEMIGEIALIEHSQLDCGVFCGKLDQIVCGPVIIHMHRMNRKILQNGSGAPGFTSFLLTDFMKVDMHWRKKRLNGNVLGILRANMEHSCVTPIDFSAISISIEDRFLQDIASTLGHEYFFHTIRNKETLNIDEKDALKIRHLVKAIKQCELPASNIVANHIAELIIKSVLSSATNIHYKLASNRGKVFQKAKEIIHSNYENPINVAILCKEIGTSERNLRYAFKEYSGLSPKKFMTHYKLNKVRKLLYTGKYEKVVEAANEVGFWHTGKFAADYKILFGEFPSEMLKAKSPLG